ncbi:unnamed protein product [Rhizophagus irregularis]|nr:unnamed protein product [Rhizophagus irregularis]CAB5392971.1 unnamed protein product [Rhizophagus irregularis]
MEWIEYDKFKDVEYLAKGGFGTVFKAIWKDGFINKWDYENDQWEREAETKVALKSLHNSQDITTQFLKEIEAHNSSCSGVGWIVRCFGITKDPETENFMMIMELKEAIYTSKLLDFKNLPEPKNTNNNEDLLGSEYSESMSFDFTKLDINSKDENN